MDIKQVDLTTMSETEILKFIIEQQRQQTEFIVALNQIQTNINNAYTQLAKFNSIEEQ